MVAPDLISEVGAENNAKAEDESKDLVRVWMNVNVIDGIAVLFAGLQPISHQRCQKRREERLEGCRTVEPTHQLHAQVRVLRIQDHAASKPTLAT